MESFFEPHPPKDEAQPELEMAEQANPNAFHLLSKNTLFRRDDEIGESLSLASRAELIAEINKRDRELTLLHQIRTTLLANPNINEVFQNIVEHIAEAFSFTLVSLYLIENSLLKMQAQVGYEHTLPEIPLDRGVNGRVASSGEPVFIHDVKTDPDYIEAEVGVSSQICVPLLNRGGESIGTLSIEAYEARQLDERDYKLCLALADHIMLAIEQSRLYIIEQRRAKQLKLLNQIGRDLAASLDVQEIIDKVTGPIRRSLGYYSVNIGMVDERHSQVVYRIAKGLPGGGQDYRRPVDSHSLTGFVVMKNEMVVVQDVSNHPRYVHVESLSNTRSEVIIPLRSVGGVIGVLDIESDKVDDFDDEDIILLKTLADQTSIALANAMRFQNIERQKAELARTNKLLAEANRLKNEFLANVSHELRTPLNSIMGYIDMILSGYFGPVPSEYKDPLERVDRNSTRLLHLINDVLDLARLEAGREVLNLDSFRLMEVINAQFDATHEQAAAKGLSFELQTDPTVPSMIFNDSVRVGQLISKLLSNALKFTKTGRITMRVANYPDKPDYFTLEVSDTGIGIPEAEFQNIFEAFRQVDGSITRTFGGTGTGLAICLKLVRMMGGTINLKSTVGAGSVFTVTLPIKVKTED